MTSYNKMLTAGLTVTDSTSPQFLVVQFERNLEPAAVPGTGPLHLLPPLPHLRLHFILQKSLLEDIGSRVILSTARTTAADLPYIDSKDVQERWSQL